MPFYHSGLQHDHFERVNYYCDTSCNEADPHVGKRIAFRRPFLRSHDFKSPAVKSIQVDSPGGIGNHHDLSWIQESMNDSRTVWLLLMIWIMMPSILVSEDGRKRMTYVLRAGDFIAPSWHAIFHTLHWMKILNVFALILIFDDSKRVQLRNFFFIHFLRLKTMANGHDILCFRAIVLTGITESFLIAILNHN